MHKPFDAGREFWLSGAFGVLGVMSVFRSVWPIVVHQNLNDDSYITLTYAKNLAHGAGFVYNHPPATLGTTTPLFAILCAVGARLIPGADAADVAIIFSIAAWLTTAGLFFACLRQVGMSTLPASIAAAIQLLLVRAWLPYIGMEIWLFQLLLILTLYLWLWEKPLGVGLCVALLALTRGEGALLAPILGVYYLVRFGREQNTGERFVLARLASAQITRFAGAGLLVCALWAAYALPVFGTMIPNTLAAKQAQAQLPSARSFLERIPSDLLHYTDTFGIDELGLTHPWLNVVWLLAVVGLWRMVRHYPQLLLLPLWALVYLLAYAVINPNAYAWYVLHLVFIIHILCAVALAYLVEQWRQPARSGWRWSIAGAIMVLTLLFLYTDLMYAATQAPAYAGDSRAGVYRALASWLRENTAPAESVAYIEIGYLGYFSQNRIVDLAGLVDPTVTAHIASDGFAWGFNHYHPDYYVDNPAFDWALANLRPQLVNYQERFIIGDAADALRIRILERTQ